MPVHPALWLKYPSYIGDKYEGAMTVKRGELDELYRSTQQSHAEVS